MNFSAISYRSTLGKLLRLPLRLVPREMPVFILQGPLRGKRWIAGSSTHGCWLGSYEYEKQHLLAQMVKPGCTVFDIGANVGFYTLLASTLVGTHGRVYAFEPVSRNVRYLRKHLDLNHLSNVTVIEAAVADRDGVALFDEGPDRSEGRISAQGKLRVEMVALDRLVETGRLPMPDYLKIDVEGAESMVLHGASNLLVKRHPVILLATHGIEVHRESCSLLIALGYALSSIDNRAIQDTDEILAEYHT
jgi:FkbM family methyltransferase